MTNLFLATFSSLCVYSICAYEPNWNSLDSRPLPEWYDEAKIGIFLHWGVFSVPSFKSEWFWNYWKDGNKEFVEFMGKNYPPSFTYQHFGPMFTAEFFNPEEWIDLFSHSGANYIVLTAKHHEGYTLWPSKHSFSWNSMDVGPKRDLVGDLFSAARKKAPHLHLGLYHSLYEWFNPLYIQDKRNKWKTGKFVEQKTLPELYELVNNYHPDVIWSDGDWEATDKYWKALDFLVWLFNESPVKKSVVVNDRWGINITCSHGSFYTCQDRYNPGVLQSHKWENCMTLDKNSWGYNRLAGIKDYLSIEELLTTMAETISCGGNLLINAGPTHDGRIPPIMEERLLQMGDWLNVNGRAIYSSKPWAYQNDTLTSGVWYTQNKKDKSIVYGIILNWPTNNEISFGSIIDTQKATVSMLGHGRKLEKIQTSKGLLVSLPPMNKVLSLKWAWVLEFRNILPSSFQEYNNISKI